MARVALLVCAMLLEACPGDRYVIGRVTDAGVEGDQDDSATESSDECSERAPSTLFCSGFEHSDLSSEWSSVASTEQATLTRTTARVHTGAGALRATTEDAESYALVLASFGALHSGDLYLRAYLFVPSGQPTEIMNILFVGDGEHTDPFQGIDLNLQSGAVQIFSPQSAARYTDSAGAPRDRWFCLRVHVVIDDERGSVRVFVDDRPALTSGAFDTLPDRGVNELRVGIDWSSNQQERFEIFIDDVVVDTAEVACL